MSNWWMTREDYERVYEHGRSDIWLEPFYWEAKGFRKLNLGCGEKPFLGWTNLDLYSDDRRVVKHDLTRCPLPFDDGHFDYVLAMHILEHIPARVEGQVYGDYLQDLLIEIARVMKAGGVLEVHVPSSLNRHTLEHLGHVRHVGRRTFEGMLVDDGHQWASSEKAKMREAFRLELIDWKRWHNFKMGDLTDYHLRKYLGPVIGEGVARALGTPECERFVFNVWKGGLV